MIKNKQVNIWRGPDPPPTPYHIWFKDEELLLRFDEITQDWELFMDARGLDKKIKEFLDAIDSININGHRIQDNPVLDASDLKVGQSGHYINSDDTVRDAISKLDSLLTTEVYEE